MSAGHADDEAAAIASDHRLAAQGWPQALLIGAAQILALLPGISHSGATMTAGLLRGLTHQDAARFAFLVAIPVIAATGLLKLPELAGPHRPRHPRPGAGRQPRRRHRRLPVPALPDPLLRNPHPGPFAIYCLIAGTASLARTTLA